MDAGFPDNVASLQGTILGALADAGVSHSQTKYVVGMGSWETKMAAIVSVEAGEPLVDTIDIHIHPINNTGNYKFLQNILTIANAAQAAGKGLGFDESWGYKETNTEFGLYLQDSVIDSRNYWQPFTPADQLFVQMQSNLAWWKHAEYVSFSWSDVLFSYLNYDTAGCIPSTSCTPSHIDNLAATAVSAALVAPNGPALTDTGSYFKALLATTASPRDTTPPTAPGNVTVTSAGAGPPLIQWSASTDDKGVQWYAVYQNGSLIGYSRPSITAYLDCSPDAGMYSVVALDAEGNASAASQP